MNAIAYADGLHIRGQRIARGERLYVVAEIGLNHGGSVDRALALVDLAAGAGASAVKLQTLHARTLVAPSCPPPIHVAVASLQEFFARFELDEAAHLLIGRRAHDAGLAFISTPFDEDAVDLLARVGADALKIASGDLTHHGLIGCAAQTGLPLILSTGMSELHEVAAALECARRHGATSVALLHCVSAYPVPAESANLATIRTLAEAFDVPVGLSDHGQDSLCASIAVALGAAIYERHVVLSGDDEAVDGAVSSTGDDLQAAIAVAERTRLLLGHGRRECLPAEAANRIPSRRGVYAARTIACGARIAAGDIVCLRPEHDIPADQWQRVIGARATREIAAGDPLLVELLDGGAGA